MKRLSHSLIILLFTLLSLSNNCYADESSNLKMQITAGFLYHFAQFTKWPTPLSVVHYCIYEDPDFSAILQKAYSNETGIDVKNINAQSNITACQIIYFSKNPTADFMKRISKQPVLSVGMEQGFTELGGIIYLYENNLKLRFYINNTAAITAGLKLSSQLLELSKEP